MEFSSQEYWSGLLCPSPGDLPDPGIEPGTPALQQDRVSSWIGGGLGVVESAPVKETQIQCLGWEDLLEKGMATRSSILAWRIPWTEEPGGM